MLTCHPQVIPQTKRQSAQMCTVHLARCITFLKTYSSNCYRGERLMCQLAVMQCIAWHAICHMSARCIDQASTFRSVLILLGQQSVASVPVGNTHTLSDDFGPEGGAHRSGAASTSVARASRWGRPDGCAHCGPHPPQRQVLCHRIQLRLVLVLVHVEAPLLKKLPHDLQVHPAEGHAGECEQHHLGRFACTCAHAGTCGQGAR